MDMDTVNEKEGEMEVKTYRARSLQDALQLVRADLGPNAAVLQTRQLQPGLWGRLLGATDRVEVSASLSVHVPSRFAADDPAPLPVGQTTAKTESQSIPPAHEQNYRAKFRNDLKDQMDNLQSLVEDLCRQRSRSPSHELPESLFLLFTDLIDAELSEDFARELIDRLRQGAAPNDLEDLVLLKARMARMIEDEIRVTGPISVNPGHPRLVALVGPTGVGKTTTIAKLAGNYHLRDRRRVGLITVDTYRIAAVEQLRTYADIIDLPMEVVSTPHEMRQAVNRLANLDLILMDTAGRSPRDEVKIRELQYMLAEAEADEVQLVLSSVSSLGSMKKTVRQFADVGVTSLLLTKVDEATGLGNLVPLLRDCKLPLSYITNGQNVPDDIEPADCRRITRMVLGLSER